VIRNTSWIVLLAVLTWGEAHLWSQESPGATNARNPAAAAGSEEDPRAAGEVPIAEREADQPPAPSSPSEQISEIQLSGLPLNGRSYNQLATLQAGVSDPSGGSASRGGGSGSLTVVGGRSTSNNFLLDGTNIMDAQNQVPRSAAGVQLGSDAVFEVQVLTSFGPEHGRGSGGVLDSITRSGTAQFHGTLFEYFRNSNLDARNFFDPGPEPTPFKRNQFGATLTGPVWKDQTFFMASFEALRDRLTETKVNFFPDALSRQGILTDCSGRVIQTLDVFPGIRPYLDLYPLPNAGCRGGGIAENAASDFLPTDESFFTARVDHKLSDQDSFFARYTFDDATGHRPDDNYLWQKVTESRQQYATLVGSHIFDLRRLIVFRAGYTRPVTDDDEITLIDIPPSLYLTPDAVSFGQIEISSLTPLGTFPALPDRKVTNTFQFATDAAIQSGAHLWRMGMQAHRYRWDAGNQYLAAGQWTFNSFENFLLGGPQGTSVEAALPGGDNDRNFRQTLFALYLEDQYRISPRFHLNLGLRYEYVSVLDEIHGKQTSLPDTLHDTEVQVDRILRDNPSRFNLAPRIGWRWTPFSGLRTVLSGGFGVYYDQMLGYTGVGRKNTAPFNNVAVNPNFDARETFPNAVAGSTATVGVLPPHIHIMDYEDMKTPTVLRYNFSVQQELSGGASLQTSYVGARGNHLLRRYETNLFPDPVTLPDGAVFFPDDCTERERLGLQPSANCRPGAGPVNPAFGSVSMLASDAQSFYNSLQVAVNLRSGAGISAQFRYTFSKSVDDDSDGPGSGLEQFGWRRDLDRGLSNFDIRHRVAMNYFWTPPLGGGQRWFNSGILSAVLGGWRLGGIISYRTGVPSTVAVNVRTPGYLFETTRPNLIAGRSRNPTEGVTEGCLGVEAGRELGTPQLYFDPCAFSLPPPGTLGNAGRNTIISPSVLNADVSVQKEFSIDSEKKLQFRAEFFNLLNHPNFDRNEGNTVTVFSGSSGRRSSSAGRLSATVGTARQIQFALRLSF